MSSGSLFHSSGAETAKALERYDLRLKCDSGVVLKMTGAFLKLNNGVSGLEYR